MSTAAMPNQGAARLENRLRIGAPLSRPVQVALAAAAQACVIDVRPVMPAALALGVAARFDFDLERAFRAVCARPRRNEHILQLVAEPRDRVVYGAGGAQVELRS